MTHITDRFVFTEEVTETITTLESAGFSHVGTTTYRGHLQDLAFFNKAGVQVEINFRYQPEDQRPVRREEV